MSGRVLVRHDILCTSVYAKAKGSQQNPSLLQQECFDTWLTAQCQNIPEERVKAHPLQCLLQCTDTVTPETPQGNAWSSEIAKEPN